jgi:hypothetical protein
MKIVASFFVSTLLLLLIGFSSSAQETQIVSGKVLHRNVSPALVQSPTQSLETYLRSAYDLKHLLVEKSVSQDKTCGDAYFVELKARSFLNNVQVEMDYYVQTLTKQSQDRLYDAIKANYETKGLPKCLLQDQFYMPNSGIIIYAYNYDPDYTTVNVPVIVGPIPQDMPCAKEIQRPVTSCWNVEDPYKN